MATKNTNKLIFRLAFLIVPFGIFTLILHDGQSTGSFGGGGYDLSGLIYGMLLFTAITLWMIWMLICYFISKTPPNRKMYLKLLFIGIIALIAAWFITPRMFQNTIHCQQVLFSKKNATSKCMDFQHTNNRGYFGKYRYHNLKICRPNLQRDSMPR